MFVNTQYVPNRGSYVRSVNATFEPYWLTPPPHPMTGFESAFVPLKPRNKWKLKTYQGWNLPGPTNKEFSSSSGMRIFCLFLVRQSLRFGSQRKTCLVLTQSSCLNRPAGEFPAFTRRSKVQVLICRLAIAQRSESSQRCLWWAASNKCNRNATVEFLYRTSWGTQCCPGCL